LLSNGENLAVPITDTTIFENGWQNIYDLVSDISDPENRGTKWVYSAFPLARFADESAYPLIVVRPLNFTGTEKLTFGTSRLVQADLSVEINIFALKANQIDTIADDIFEKLESSLSTFWTNKLKNVRLLRSRYAHFERGGMKVHFKSLVYGFEFDYS